MTSKDGFYKQKQRYKCAACGRRFIGGERLDNQVLWQEYTEGKQTYKQLSVRYSCSIKTIQRRIDSVKVQRNKTFPSFANVLMDTTYFGRSFGVMVFKDSITKQILHKQYVTTETNKLHLQGIEVISQKGIKVQSIICDGRKGLFKLFGDIPIQYCNFHQIKTIRKYLTKNPKMQASKDLWELTLLLVHTNKESFIGGLNDWYIKWHKFLNERKINKNGKKRYLHKRLRSAYRSLTTNLP